MAEPRVFLGGRIVPRSRARVSIGDAAFRHGEGAFETMRARGDRVFRLPEHLRRLRASAAGLGWRLPWPDADLEAAIGAALRANRHPEARVRLQATPGEGGLDGPEGPPLLLVEAERFVPVDPRVRRRGVRVAVSPLRLARGWASAGKTCSYVDRLWARRAARARGCFEAVLRSDAGRACEAAMANLFAVRGAALWTCPVEAGALPGITRGAVLEIARARGLEVRLEAPEVEALRAADEVFLTSTAVEVLPVARIDDATVGRGRPGPITRDLGEAYRRLLDDALGPLAG
jgi:branched-chain amino acid aminotransferase